MWIRRRRRRPTLAVGLACLHLPCGIVIFFIVRLICYATTTTPATLGTVGAVIDGHCRSRHLYQSGGCLNFRA